MQDADLILLDEPFNAVDEKTLADLIALIDAWHAEGRTIVVVVHDLDLVRAHFPEALLLARRPVAWGSTPTVLTGQNLLRARDFRETWDEAAPWCAADEDAGPNARMPVTSTRLRRTAPRGARVIDALYAALVAPFADYRLHAARPGSAPCSSASAPARLAFS